MSSFNKELLNAAIQEYIINYDGDITRLAFSKSDFEGVTTKELIQQIEGRRRIAKKLPAWSQMPGLMFPPKLNLEQSSSEFTALYKASLLEGSSLADLTGGFGVDSYFFSKQFDTVSYFEQNAALAQITTHNLTQLGAKNVLTASTDGIEAIKDAHFDVIYLDPARRNNQANKVVSLKDCEPDILSHRSYLLDRCKYIILKTSPMLDITLGMIELAHVQEVHIVAVDNEVKELLWVLSKENEEQTTIKAVNITRQGQDVCSFSWGAEEHQIDFGPPGNYLYEPNAAIMKSGQMSAVGARYKLIKLQLHSHLFTSYEFIDGFPGRSFQINQWLPYKKGEMKSFLTKTKANITTRNFPESVAELRKRWKISDGGDRYLFFTTLTEGQKVVLECSRVTT